MSRVDPNRVIRRWSATSRADVTHWTVAILGLPLFLWMLQVLFAETTPEGTMWRARLAFLVFFLAFPLWSWLRCRLGTRYTLSADSVSARSGFFGRATSEIRILDIRNISLRQSFLDRILRIGDIGYSSAAGDNVEVTFRRVSNPARIRDGVRRLQQMLDDGTLSDREYAELEWILDGRAMSPPADPSSPAAPALPADDDAPAADKPPARTND